MISIGIIGTAKNTGKTTTLSVLINKLKKYNIAVTGIGYDGEEIDNVTNLPKPRLYFEKGVLIATAEQCLIKSGVKYAHISNTNIFTSLGEVVIAQIEKPGLVVIAGPNKVKDLKTLLSLLSNMNVDYTFVDGSLNRMSPMYVLDKLVFATGGTRNISPAVLAKELQTIENIFSFSKTPLLNRYVANTMNLDFTKTNIVFQSGSNDIVSFQYNSDNFSVVHLNSSSIFDRSDIELLIEEINKVCSKEIYSKNNMICQIILPPYINCKIVTSLVTTLNKKYNCEIVFNSPISLLIGESFDLLDEFYLYISNNKISLKYLYKPSISCITVNPFYAEYQGISYTEKFLDKEFLINAIKDNVSVPVYNVKYDSIDIQKTFLADNDN